VHLSAADTACGRFGGLNLDFAANRFLARPETGAANAVIGAVGRLCAAPGGVVTGQGEFWRFYSHTLERLIGSLRVSVEAPLVHSRGCFLFTRNDETEIKL
jgi:hypothetical protein